MIEKALLVCWSGFTKEKRDKREMESEPETVYERGGREWFIDRIFLEWHLLEISGL